MARFKTSEPILCGFNKVELSVPRLRLIKLAMRRGQYNTQEETIFLRVFQWKAEIALKKILHTLSLAEKGLLKSAGSPK